MAEMFQRKKNPVTFVSAAIVSVLAVPSGDCGQQIASGTSSGADELCLVATELIRFATI